MISSVEMSAFRVLHQEWSTEQVRALISSCQPPRRSHFLNARSIAVRLHRLERARTPNFKSDHLQASLPKQ